MKRLQVVGATLAVTLAFAGPAAAGVGYSDQALKAMGERYEAMADHYLGVGTGGGYSPQALRALGERWQAAARYEQQASLEQARRQASAFDWADAGIGALAAIAAVALLGLGVVGVRSHGERSASPAAS
jgi:hypothetical protein